MMSNSLKLLTLFLPLSLSLAFGGTKEEIIRLQSDVLQLQNQIRMLQKTVDEKEGMIISLLEQVNDQVAKGSLAFDDMLAAVNSAKAQTSSLEQSIGAVVDQLELLSSKLDETNSRVASLHRKLEDNQMQVQSLRTLPQDVTAEVEPDRVYSATYNDYLMGNYSLAVSGFQDFLANFPDSEYADNAAYYLGDSYLKQGRHELALQAFDQVINLYPKGDKTPVAYYKKALALEEMQRLDQAIDTLKKLVRLHSKSPEAELAKQQLAKLGVE